PSPAMSRTRPTKLATPPMRRFPSVRVAISRPTSNGSRCTRITASSPGDRRKQGDLVAGPHRMVGADIFLVHGGTDDGAIGQRFGMAGPARLQPVDQLADGGHVRRRADLLFANARAGAQPRKIQDLHLAHPKEPRSIVRAETPAVNGAVRCRDGRG